MAKRSRTSKQVSVVHMIPDLPGDVARLLLLQNPSTICINKRFRDALQGLLSTRERTILAFQRYGMKYMCSTLYRRVALAADAEAFVRGTNVAECEKLGILADWDTALEYRNVAMCTELCARVLEHGFGYTRMERIIERFNAVTDMIADSGAKEFAALWCTLADACNGTFRGNCNVFANALRLHRDDYVLRVMENGNCPYPRHLRRAIKLGNPANVIDMVFHAIDSPSPRHILHELIDDYRESVVKHEDLSYKHDDVVALIDTVNYLVAKIEGPVNLGNVWRVPCYLPIASQLRDLLRRHS